MITRVSISGLRYAAIATKRKVHHPEDILSVALVELTGLGDVISMLPALSCFRSLFPSAQLRLFVDSRWVEFLHSLSLPATIHGIKDSRTPAGTNQAVRLIRDMKPTLACSMSPPRRNALVTLASGAPCVAGYLRYTNSRAPYLRKRPVDVLGLPAVKGIRFHRDHIWQRAAKVCEALGFRGELPPPQFGIATTTMSRVRHELSSAGLMPAEEYLVIHPFAGWKYREWPQQSFIDLGERLVENGRTHVVFLWEEEKEGRIPVLRQHFAGHHSVSFAPSLTLLESAVLISGGTLFIGNDSGPLHLASALGVPSVGLFGPSTPSLTAPKSASSSGLYHQVDCSPCEQRSCAWSANICMHMIPVEEVLAAALSVQRRSVHA